jgi:hypothetical protein
MEKKIWIIAIIILVVLIIGAVLSSIYLSPPKVQTYNGCVQQALQDSRVYGFASEEIAGAERTDDNGNLWIKQEDGSWKTDSPGFENTVWGDSTIDEQKGGAKYTPKVFPECEKYL